MENLNLEPIVQPASVQPKHANSNSTQLKKSLKTPMILSTIFFALAALQTIFIALVMLELIDIELQIKYFESIIPMTLPVINLTLCIIIAVTLSGFSKKLIVFHKNDGGGSALQISFYLLSVAYSLNFIIYIIADSFDGEFLGIAFDYKDLIKISLGSTMFFLIANIIFIYSFAKLLRLKFLNTIGRTGLIFGLTASSASILLYLIHILSNISFLFENESLSTALREGEIIELVYPYLSIISALLICFTLPLFYSSIKASSPKTPIDQTPTKEDNSTELDDFTLELEKL